MTNREVMTLQLLIEHPRGLYGSDVVRLSGGSIGTGTVYSVLERLVARGYVDEHEDRQDDGGLPRTRHTITEAGRRALIGDVVPSPALG